MTAAHAPDRARVPVGRIALTVLAAVLYGLGWLAATVTALTISASRALASSWPAAAIRTGWRDAHRQMESLRRPSDR